MNIETKNIIKWGIPGWIFLLSSVLYLFFEDTNSFVFPKSKDNITLLGIGGIVAGAGVPIGYIIHQISMFFGVIIKTDRMKDFKNEYELDNIFIHNKYGDKKRMTYIQLLTRVHELRALKYSHLLSIFFIICLETFVYKSIDTYFYVAAGINLALLLIVHCNQMYFEGNLKYFLYRIMQEGN